MYYYNRIQNDMYSAMKSGNKEKTATLRTILSILKSKRIDKQNELSKEDELKELRTFAKQRKEAMAMYQNGGRNDLVQNEKNELGVVESYLPKMMDDESVKQLVRQIIIETGASKFSDIGKVMPQVMKVGKGLIDGKTAQKIVRELLS
tara:strand:- start:639 stop:1082 length:444 start_codon:yes stop_codon:yes gene_type:complete